jgi:hypothetical protein
MENGGLSKKDKKYIKCSLLVLVVLSPLLLIPLSVPIAENAVIVMHEDEATELAISTLRNKIPNIQVIDYGSLQYHLTVSRLIRPTIWLSHGNEEGILLDSHIISWEDFSHLTRITPSNDIILACESANIYEYVGVNEVVGFEGDLDARLAGLIGSVLILSQNLVMKSGVIQEIIETTIGLIGDIISGSLEIVPLGIIPSWWGVVKAGLIGVITGIYFLSGESQIPIALASTSNPVLFTGLLSFFVSLLGYIAYLVVGSIFPSISSFINWMYPVLGAATGVILSLALGGVLPGASYFIFYIGGWLASLFGIQVSWAVPWSRIAFAASAAIFIISALDVLLVAYWTYFV